MNTTQPHRIVRWVLLAAILGGMGILPTSAQLIFNSGSNASYGPMNITANTTLALPADGIFHCTTITVAVGATLKFTPNALNTPVYLLATGDVAISGSIDVSGVQGTASLGGVGGPGGFAGGRPTLLGLPAGDGHGPGAGRAGSSALVPYVGSAGYSTAGTSAYSTSNNGGVYGTALLVPLVGGSGGGGTTGGLGGAGGGGALLIASNTRIDASGQIVSSSASYLLSAGNTGLGSGGAIRLVSPIVAGAGLLEVRGGQNTWYSNARGGSGRIRIDCMDRRALAFTYNNSSLTVGANMVTFPPNLPRLDITQAAGNNIAVGNAAVFFMLPQGSSTNQTVTVQASNFGALVPIRVTLTPDNGSSSVYDVQIDNTTVNPATVTVPVVVPVNVQVHVEAWTR